MRGVHTALRWMLCLSLTACARSQMQPLQPPENRGADEVTADDALVIGTLLPDEECVITNESTILLRGNFDVRVSEQCVRSYMMSLLVHNHLARANDPSAVPPVDGPEPNTLRITDAHVSLLGDEDRLLDVGELRNPFVVTTHATVPPSIGDAAPGAGVVLVEAIPRVYRRALADLGERRAALVAEITLSGETNGGAIGTLAPFRHVVELCIGCLHVCSSDFTPEAQEAIFEHICPDNAGADGRACVDPDC